MIVSASLAPANFRRAVEDDLLDGFGEGWLVGDANYHSPTLAEEIARALRHRPRSARKDGHEARWASLAAAASRLTGRHRMKRAWTRDVWRPASRFWRKTLSHTCCVVLWQGEGLSPSCSPDKLARLGWLMAESAA